MGVNVMPKSKNLFWVALLGTLVIALSGCLFKPSEGGIISIGAPYELVNMVVRGDYPDTDEIEVTDGKIGDFTSQRIVIRNHGVSAGLLKIDIDYREPKTIDLPQHTVIALAGDKNTIVRMGQRLRQRLGHFVFTGQRNGRQGNSVRLTKLIELNINNGIKLVDIQEKLLRHQKRKGFYFFFILRINNIAVQLRALQYPGAQFIADAGFVIDRPGDGDLACAQFIGNMLHCYFFLHLFHLLQPSFLMINLIFIIP